MCACIWKMLSVCSAVSGFFFSFFSFSLAHYYYLSYFSLSCWVKNFICYLYGGEFLLLSQEITEIFKIQTKPWNTCSSFLQAKNFTEPSFSAVATFYVNSSDCTINAVLNSVWIRDVLMKSHEEIFIFMVLNCRYTIISSFHQQNKNHFLSFFIFSSLELNKQAVCCNGYLLQCNKNSFFSIKLKVIKYGNENLSYICLDCSRQKQHIVLCCIAHYRCVCLFFLATFVFFFLVKQCVIDALLHIVFTVWHGFFLALRVTLIFFVFTIWCLVFSSLFLLLLIANVSLAIVQTPYSLFVLNAMKITILLRLDFSCEIFGVYCVWFYYIFALKDIACRYCCKNLQNICTKQTLHGINIVSTARQFFGIIASIRLSF